MFHRISNMTGIIDVVDYILSRIENKGRVPKSVIDYKNSVVEDHKVCQILSSGTGGEGMEKGV